LDERCRLYGNRIVQSIEQQLTRLDAGVASLKRAQAGLRRYKAAVLKAACEGRLVPQDAGDEPADALLRRILDERRAKWEAEQIAKMQTQGRMILDDGWRAKYQEPQGPDVAGLPELPKGWTWATAEQLSDETRSITYGVIKLGEHDDAGVPTLRSSNIRHLRLELDGVKKIDPKLGLIPVIFRKAQNKIQDPAKLRRLIELINGETWMGLGIDIKGAIYEGLLEKNAQDTKSGAGQYFTPRPLIQAMVDVMQPTPGQTICDPGSGTGGFLLAAHDAIAAHHAPLDRDQWEHLRHHALHGWEIVDNTARLCVMNLYLHGIGVNGSASPITVGDSLAADPGARFDMVLTNPPFGKKSSVTFVNEQGETRREAQTIVRDDFWTSTSN
jgi:type I restriction-modification system DNA methylase subunit